MVAEDKILRVVPGRAPVRYPTQTQSCRPRPRPSPAGPDPDPVLQTKTQTQSSRPRPRPSPAGPDPDQAGDRRSSPHRAPCRAASRTIPLQRSPPRIRAASSPPHRASGRAASRTILLQTQRVENEKAGRLARTPTPRPVTPASSSRPTTSPMIQSSPCVDACAHGLWIGGSVGGRS